MKLQRITLFQHNLPVKGGAYRMANASVTHLDSTIVRVETDCGTVGWGETCTVGPTYAPSHAEGARAALIEMAPALIGVDLDKPVLLHRKMGSLLMVTVTPKPRSTLPLTTRLARKPVVRWPICWAAQS